MRYSAKRKEAVLRKMLSPHSRSIRELVEEEGISEPTLYNWRKEARSQGRLLPDAENTPEGWNSKDKFAAVLEGAALNEAELGEYCRQWGLYPEQIHAWRAACEQANDWDRLQNQRLRGRDLAEWMRLLRGGPYVLLPQRFIRRSNDMKARLPRATFL